jgi:hypothetical protein
MSLEERFGEEEEENPAAVDLSVVFRSGDEDCGHRFASIVMASNESYATRLNYDCPRCKSNHLFVFESSHLLDTPSQTRNFEEYCTSMQITDRDVQILK